MRFTLSHPKKEFIVHWPGIWKSKVWFLQIPFNLISVTFCKLYCFFTGIAVSTLTPVAPEYASLIQGTIAAAAVINEIIAVFMAKKGFEWAGELPGPKLRGGVHP